MTERLTQSEIDSLLRGAQPAAAAAEAVPYNFLQPPRISKEHRVALQSIHERFALALQSFLSARLRTPVELAVVSAEQATFTEAVQALASPCAAYVFRLTATPAVQGYWDLSAELAGYLVDRLFGGAGDSPGPVRPLTALERAVITGLVERTLELYRDAWQDHLAFSPQIEGFESSPDALNITTREDNCLVTHVAFRAPTAQGYFTLCYPLTAIEGFLAGSVGGRRGPGGPAADSGARELVEAALLEAHLTVAARFPALWLSARALADLKPGQVLETGHPVDEPIEVHINGVRRYLGTVGQTRRRLGVCLTSLLATPAGIRPAARQGLIR
jgi:flagellar motor switch protein FliM